MDRTVPWIGLEMRLDTLDNLPVYPLPERFSWRFFAPGDEAHWTRIETSAGEFTNTGDALKGFRKYYPTDDLLDQRMIFLTDGDVPFATATAWFADDMPGAMGRLHWVSVDAAHQRRGLSWPLVSLAMGCMRELGHACANLTTQTCSWPAIKVYHRFGFMPCVRSAEEVEGWRIVSEKTGIDFRIRR